MAKVVDFGENYYLFKIDYKYDFLTARQKQSIIDNFLSISGFDISEEEEENKNENEIFINDSKLNRGKVKRYIVTGKKNIVFGAAPGFDFKLWLEFRKTCLDIFLNSTEIIKTNNIKSFENRWTIGIPPKNISKIFDQIFLKESPISAITDNRLKDFTSFTINTKDIEQNNKLFIGILLDKGVKISEIVEFRISYSLHNILKEKEIKQNIEDHLKQADKQFEIINERFISKIITK